MIEIFSIIARHNKLLAALNRDHQVFGVFQGTGDPHANHYDCDPVLSGIRLSD
jgi:hypothetical protein